MFRSGFTFMVVASILLVSCINNREKPVDSSIIYFDYMVTGDEENNRVTTKLQYRLGGRNGDAFRLKAPAGTVMDGVPVSPDSAAFNGVYYEVISEADGFAGRHLIEFTDLHGVKYPTEFEFPVFSLEKELPEAFDRTGLEIQLKGLDSTDKIRIILTDTSFYGKGVERVDSVGTGRIVITTEELSNLSTGPVHLELVWEKDNRFVLLTKRGGRIYLYYSLQRELMLQDSAKIATP